MTGTRDGESPAASGQGRLLCVGDIHGSARELEILLAAVAPGPADQLVFLGDYVDRGPASNEVIALLVDLQARLPGTVFLRGNHEEMMMDFLGMEGARGNIFLRAGGASTVASYGLDPEAATPEKFRSVLPETHRRFLEESLRLHHQEGDYLFVHAGCVPVSRSPTSIAMISCGSARNSSASAMACPRRWFSAIPRSGRRFSHAWAGSPWIPDVATADCSHVWI